MKQICIILIILLKINYNTYSQSDTPINVKIYSVEWNLKTKFPYTINNFKDYYKYYFEIKNSNLETMFMDYSDCTAKLSSQKELIIPDSIRGDKKKINALVELVFDKKIVQLFFDSKGNYYLQNKWHVKNEGLYYALFKYFSDTIIHQILIEEAMKNRIDDLWHNN